MLNIKIQNLGNIKEANIKVGKLTIFAGANNSGKTYINYLLYALLDKKYSLNSSIYNKFVEEAKENGICKIDLIEFIQEEYMKLKTNLEKTFAKTLDRFFSAEDGTFSKFKLTLFKDIDSVKDYSFRKTVISELSVGKDKVILEVSKEQNSKILTLIVQDPSLPNDIYSDYINSLMYNILFSELTNDTFLLPAERTGINLFYQELNTYRNSLINNLQKTKINPLEVLKDMMVSKYPQPIADYIDFLNNMSNLKKRKSELASLNDFLRKKIINGKYKVDRNGSISFLPYKNNFKGTNYQNKIDLHLSSSTVKTFFSLEFYIEHMAKEGSYLIIDEPELNLHPDNQRNIARLLASLVNRGVNVVISTHSDYIIRELNNLIMLKEPFKAKKALMEKYGYRDEELLEKDDVKAYIVDGGTIEPMEINLQEGIIATTFDNVVNELNSSSDDIYYTKLEELDNE